MHFVFATRGHIDHVERFIRELRSQYLDFNIYDKAKNALVPIINQIRVQPVQLWDITFPEPMRDSVLNTILGGTNGEPVRAREKPAIWAAQKMIGLKPIPKDYDRTRRLRMPSPDFMDVFAIG